MTHFKPLFIIMALVYFWPSSALAECRCKKGLVAQGNKCVSPSPSLGGSIHFKCLPPLPKAPKARLGALLQVGENLKCIDNMGHEVDGANLHVWDCNTTNDNQWFGLAPSKDKKFVTITARKSSRCLTVVKGSKKVGALIEQWQCKGKNEQAWELIPTGVENPWELLDPKAYPWFGLRNKKSGKCLSLQNKKNKFGSKFLVQSNCSAKNRDQRFRRLK